MIEALGVGAGLISLKKICPEKKFCQPPVLFVGRERSTASGQEQLLDGACAYALLSDGEAAQPVLHILGHF